MKPGIYLEEALKDVLRTSNFVHGMFNLIVAPCGSGKTTAAINVISKQASSSRTALILIDTTNGKQRLAKLKELTMPYAFYEESLERTWFSSAEFDPSKIIVTTYAQFGVWEYHNPGLLSCLMILKMAEHIAWHGASIGEKQYRYPEMAQHYYRAAQEHLTLADELHAGAVRLIDMAKRDGVEAPEEMRKMWAFEHEMMIDEKDCIQRKIAMYKA